MAGSKRIDTYANVAAIYVEESVANTFTTAKFAFPFSIMDKMALVIQRIEYTLGGMDQLNSSTDRIVLGLFASSSITSVDDQSDPLMIDNIRIQRLDLGAAATGLIWPNPVIKDFTNLAGGGLLVAPNPLYAGVKATGAAGVTSSWVRLYYTYLELASDEYWQLVESRRIISD